MTLVGPIISVLLFYAVVVCAQDSLTIIGTTNVKYGSNVTLNCSFISTDADTTWTTTATSSDELDYIDSDVSSILTITRVTLDHMGNYTCTSNDTGNITEATVTLTVYVPAPVVTTPLTDVLVDHNDNITLTCTFQSLTTPNVTWSTGAMNRVLPYPTLSSSSISHTSVLMLNNVTLDNEGLYTCTATNEGGMIQSFCSVDILAPIPSSSELKPDYAETIVLIIFGFLLVFFLVPVLLCFVPAMYLNCIREDYRKSSQSVDSHVCHTDAERGVCHTDAERGSIVSYEPTAE